MKILFGDTETYSEADLTTVGAHAYAEHPSTEIMVWQWALGDDEPVVEDLTGRKRPSARSLALLNDPGVLLVFHNANFDRAVISKVWGLDLPPERFYDTMAQAMAHSLPGSLDKVGTILGLGADEAKDKRGGELIRLFCKPRPKNMSLRRATRDTHPNEWAEFLTYSYQDIIAMRAIHKRLPAWNYNTDRGAGKREWELWQVDQRINSRGMAIDLELARCALRTTDRVKQDLRDSISAATDGAVTSATKRDQMLAYLLEEHGVTLPDLKVDTLRRRMEDPHLPEHIRLLLSIRMEAGMASSAKYKAALAATSSDGRLRGTMQFAGAQRTGRWAHRLFQPGNMKRPDPDMDEHQVAVLTEACMADVLDLVHPEPMRCLANIVRGCIVAPAGKKLVIADLSNIEGRMLAWLAGEQWKVDAFAEIDAGHGADMYKRAYARSFNVQPESVNKNQRQIGKVQELGLGYGGGVGAFITFAAVYNMDLGDLARAVHETAGSDALLEAGKLYDWNVKKNRSTFGLPRDVWVACQVLVTAWRQAHPGVVSFWKAVEDAVHSALRTPGVAFDAGPHIRVQCDGAWTRVRLPSGRCLCYLKMDVDDNGGLSYYGVNQYTRRWDRIRTYSGKLCISEGSLVLTDAGWVRIENVTSVHRVWDGVEWVTTDGAVCNGEREVINAFGAYMTGDHLVLTREGWTAASATVGAVRAECPLPVGTPTPAEPPAARHVSKVYDLVNCGPRHRFVILADGAPLIVHNCENVTQAAARDVLAHNMPRIDGSGYEIVLSVHDELLTETPDTDAYTWQELASMMATNPPWATGLPLAAAGFETARYRKE